VTVTIHRFSARRASDWRRPLVELLRDAVERGASVGFLPPLTPEEALAYWRGVEEALAKGHRELLVAERDGKVVGAVQLELAEQPNARHRAEVAKLLVHTQAQRQGIARELMREAEELARGHGRTLLVLDTREGDAAEQLYLRLGYVRAGAIPGYARSGAGRLETTVLFYRQLEPPAS
jgi:acetyltransferase